MSISMKKVYTGYGFELTQYGSGIIDIQIPNGQFDVDGFKLFMNDLVSLSKELTIIPDTESYMEEVKQLIKEKKKLQAIKIIKEHTAFDLKKCKQMADQIEMNLPKGIYDETSNVES